MSVNQKLGEFLSQHPSIQNATPSSAEYADLREAYVVDPTVNPNTILRPQTVEEIAAIISFLGSNGIDFTIRGGGHDMFGRAMKDNTVVVDVRLINHVEVHPESLTATIGGGTLIGRLMRTLQAHSLTAAVGTISSVGYVGWAMYGGYGPYSPQFGLGTDQILRAKVVNAQGQIVEADADLLKAIRGAGGAFGVIAEITIPVHRVEKILAGVVFYKSEDLHSAFQQFNQGYRSLSTMGIPTDLSLQQGVVITPNGPAFIALFVWNSADIETGKQWLDTVSGLAPEAFNTVQETTPIAWLEAADKLVSKATQGRVWTINLKTITDEVIEVIGEFLAKMPDDPQMLFDMHELRGCSPSAQSKPDSVFSARESHFMFEILSITGDADRMDEVLEWGKQFQAALLKTNPENILPASYISFLPRDELDMSRAFVDNYQFLLDLKRSCDPGNVFRLAIPQF
ncbi:hypothetical protein FE257_012961 [Aspergillus nanangensis]|uniref:FAD-binding PCMH-type domain-containing protein n=1 Tax=Aspergillus nanangensis TaxID=2582783 RepID=A0AAD4GPK5_ASPNN|nr:hypothetical protein FE257_012961 [Aspergillus nanangensis]